MVELPKNKGGWKRTQHLAAYTTALSLTIVALLKQGGFEIKEIRKFMDFGGSAIVAVPVGNRTSRERSLTETMESSST